jgi:hypothetical protein
MLLKVFDFQIHIFIQLIYTFFIHRASKIADLYFGVLLNFNYWFKLNNRRNIVVYRYKPNRRHLSPQTSAEKGGGGNARHQATTPEARVAR